MGAETLGPAVPDYVDPARVFDFDIYEDPRLKADLHAGFKSLHAEAPDIFFTPRNGGHWVVTRHDLITHIMRDSEHFSNSEMDVPKTGAKYRMIPLNLDPPEHAPYRAALMQYFSPKAVAALEPRMRQWAARLIDEVAGKGRYDLADLGAAFPVSIFMEMMGLPMDRFADFRDIVVEYFGHTTVERRVELQALIFDEMTTIIEARRGRREDDLVSKLLDLPVQGRLLTLEELQSICFLLFIAGLDTVANTLAFAFRHLAEDSALQERLIAEPEAIPRFVEEALRRYAIVNGVRTVKKDFDFEGASFRVGDMVAASLPLGGMDERINPDPMRFDIDRENRQHLTFSIGPHMCLGHFLARVEMKMLTEEWLRRVGRFRLAPGFKPEFRAGFVMSLKRVPVEWDVGAIGAPAPSQGA